MSDIDYKLIGERIKQRRKKRGYTQDIMADFLGYSSGYVSQIECGTTHVNLDTLARICNYLECDISEIIGASNNANMGYMIGDLNSLYEKLNKSERQILYRLLLAYLQTKKER